MKLAYADRDTYYADPAFVKVPAAGLLSKEYAKERAALIDPKRASKAFIAGDPTKYDPQVKQWTYWKADVKDGTVRDRAVPRRRDGLARAGFGRRQQGHDAHRDRRQGGQRVRLDAERRVDRRRGDPRRHRHRHERARRAVLARQHEGGPASSAGPPALHVDAEPRPQGRRADDGASAPRAATTRIRRSCRPSSASSSSGTRGIRTCTRRSSARARRRSTSTVRSGRTRPGFNKLNVEAAIPEAVYKELQSRGHDVSRLRTFGMSGCATVVMIDPATGNRFAGADPRRDCYAMAY